ncbi:adenylate kinase 9 [Phyllostomus discolor]|uniref:Adenylate kinase 9 n=1 Tax=Phyllostomus discolor TaxID=89673 RepID=A0A7E6DMU7_9CHIR|nr:adenylate kinase 9 [Phyllostomus discolor]
MISQEKIEEHPFVDIFSEDEADEDFMLSKPVCFVIFGKPGIGKTTLARQIAQEWKCIHVEALTILEEQIASESETGVMLQTMLVSGHSIPEELVIKLILEKLKSPEVSHLGYIITELPTLSQDAMTTLQQIDLIRNLDMKPDIIINIKCPDYDLCQRVSGQRQHSSTGFIYTRDQWDLEFIENQRRKKKEAQKEAKSEEEGEEEEEQEEEETFIAEMQMVAEILQHLVQRPEDYLENIESLVKLYKEAVLHALEEVMAEHNSLHFIELDGNRPPEELFTTVMSRLKFLNLRRAAILTKLQSAEEEMNDTMDNDELFRTLSSYKVIAPRYRWKRSRWGRTCPVVLKEGHIIPGLPDLSVSFLGKMYCLSSEGTLKTFLSNPRPYLLPPMPAPPFKVFIFGPQSSGKTTLSNLLAEHYKGKVVDFVKHIQPRFDTSLETLRKNTIAEATEAAIKTVKERLRAELEAKRKALRELESELKAKEYDKFSSDKSLEGELSSLDDDGSAHESQRESSLEDNQEAKMKSDSDNAAKTDTDEDLINEVTADHPEVVSMVKETVKMTDSMNFEHPHEKYAEILEEVLEEIAKENKKRFSGVPKYGGWVLDNCPVIRELWIALIEKGIIPDLVICLSDTENDGKCLLNRLYLENKPEIDSKILERLLDELQKKKIEEEAARKTKEEELRLEKENGRLLEALDMKRKEEEEADADADADEEIEGEELDAPEEPEALEVAEETEGLLPEESEVSEIPETESESVSEPIEETTVGTEIPKEPKEGLETKLPETVELPKFPEDAYPDVPEMEPVKEKIRSFATKWKSIERTFTDSAIQVFHLEIAGKTPEELLQKAVETMERPFQYAGWELTLEDYEEETEDFHAETEVEEELEDEEEEEEENEDKMKEKKRHLGDTKHFCPVVLKENFVLQPGNTEEAAKYQEKIYYFSTPEAKEKFLAYPQEYVAHKEPLKAPPLRICLLGPRGSGKTVCGRQLAENLGIFHIQFEEFLQEKLMLKTEKKIGPEFEEDAEEEQLAKQELEELAVRANVKIEEENTKKPISEIQFTEEEEAIRLNIMENEQLPPEILDAILSEWWFKEPIRSTGFILDGFPRYSEEARLLAEHGFFPDAAVVLQVDDQDVSDRLLPPQIEKWRLKQKAKLERKKLIKEMKAKIKDDMIAKRRAELLAERERKKKEIVREDEDISDEDLEEDDDDIDNILEDEFPKDEDLMSEEDEEQESDAVERLKGELGEKFEADMRNLQAIQNEFDRFLIPVILINASRKIHIVQYMLNTKLKPLVENRASIFEKCYPISSRLAQKMLSFTYKYISTFGYWDPVKLSEGETIKPVESSENPVYPVIHRQYIYFLSSKETKEKFMKNPIKYIRQPKPKPRMPIKIAIVGPPKSGKTTVAKTISNEYGLKRLSIGEALRYVLNHQADTELALMLNWHLHKGMTVPDQLATQALEVSLMGNVCNTAGVIIDGYPVTEHQVSLLEDRSVTPLVILELDVPSKEIFKRLLLEKKNKPSLPYPLHNSTKIIAVRYSKYRKNIVAIRQYYQEQHQNWYVIDGFHSKWWVCNEAIKNIKTVNGYMQIYLERIKAGKAACIDKLCITSQELISRLGEFGQFCPVSLAESYELVDCSVTDSLEFAAEFRGHYYKMDSRKKLNKFLENPELYVPPLAPHPLPPADMIPKRLTLSELKKRFPKCAELQGYCPVTYQDGNQRYEALVPGNIKYAIEYRDRIYICESNEKLQKFLRLPGKYWDQKLPYKLPPLKEPINLTSLPLPGYLEQGIATSLIKAMNAAGCLKPKFPFLSIEKSALLYIAFHLKAFNPKASEYTRKKYKKKMEQFIERCELITYLGAKMTRKYKEPQFRPIDFDHKLQTFISLKNIDPINE